jgi:hypothetical protein
VLGSRGRNWNGIVLVRYWCDQRDRCDYERVVNLCGCEGLGAIVICYHSCGQYMVWAGVVVTCDGT